MKGTFAFGILVVSLGVLTLAGVEHYRPNPLMAALINSSADLRDCLAVENKITGNYTLTPNGVKALTDGAFVAITVGLCILVLESFLALFRREPAPAPAKEVS